ncbi:hypothetical protein M422DRAFT_48273 [Sphaerobolus stellatus SS14]|uniref:Uncharacterized protein n=1 Tax=Sphaerobolus stellatus (strain SS14) TaxID=990650 RepID=A0A0C9VVA6_SPHS4|nr:hypothetical protein M422DRAFT_48273 [Sphaerobolus stellatus SS14]
MHLWDLMVCNKFYLPFSDITPTSGWRIMGCNANWEQGPHDIHMKTWEPIDQSILTHLKKQLATLNQTTPVTVCGLTLDHNITSISSFCWDVTSIFGDVTSAITSVASNVADATSFNKSDNSSNIPLTLDQSFTLVDLSLQCTEMNNNDAVHLKIDVDAHVNMQLSYSYVLAGSFLPLPEVDEAAIFAYLAGDASFKFDLKFKVQGTYDTKAIDLFKAGLPLLSIPGVSTLGPEFVLAA